MNKRMSEVKFEFNFDAPVATTISSKDDILEKERLAKVVQEKKNTIQLAQEQKKVVEKTPVKDKSLMIPQRESATAFEAIKIQNITTDTTSPAQIESPATSVTRKSNGINYPAYAFTQADIGKHVNVEGRGTVWGLRHEVGWLIQMLFYYAFFLGTVSECSTHFMCPYLFLVQA